MKSMKKFFAMMLSLALALVMTLPVFAADGDSVSKETYTAYKLFDASVVKNNDGEITSVSYTIPSNSGWLSDVQQYANPQESGLTLTESGDGDEYVVSVTDNFSAQAFAAAMSKKTAGKTVSGTANEISEGTTTINVTGGDGYYLIVSSLGATAALSTDGSNTVTIVEKNTVPSITKKVWEDSTKQYADSATIDIVDEISYQLTVNTGTNSEGSGTGVDANYVITDQLPTGISYKANSIAVKVGDTAWAVGTDYTVTYDSAANKLTVTLLSTGALAKAAQNANIVLTYSAIAGNSMTVGQAGNTNTATLTYSNQSDIDIAIVYTYEIGAVDEDGEPTFSKVDGDDNALGDVEFVLSKTADGSTVYAKVTNDWLTGWDNSKGTDTTLKTDSEGAIHVKGLDAGTYILTETKALPGYNLLTDTITVTVSETGEVTYKLTSSEGAAQPSIVVENNTGSTLPETGGMGTTVLYLAGAVLVVGAGVLLVVRRRMSAER